MSALAGVVAGSITGFTRLVTGAQARWLGCAPAPVQRIYYGNHSSHADFVLIWSSLPPALRARTRPVAGADYWEKGRVKRYLIHEVLNGVLVDREKRDASVSPVDTIVSALDAGHSLIFFPEGTRNTTGEILLPFKSGLYHIACRRPAVELVPVWMDNLGRVLPKGEFIPVPLLCSINFGVPLRVEADEDKDAFLTRARDALLELREGLRRA
jgi:1-acyl-sn-glycerol-3-phosphate acyltransferase